DNRSFNTHKPQFSGLTLAELDLSGVYLRGTTFSNTSFDDAVLDRADLSMALFVDVQFSREIFGLPRHIYVVAALKRPCSKTRLWIPLRCRQATSMPRQ